jgi:putative tryptophan/tyrosine transport system substrate-binding protein
MRNDGEIEGVIAALAKEPGNGLIFIPDIFAVARHQQIIALVAKDSIPTIYPFRTYAKDGGLISYGIDLADGYRLAAT